MIRHLSTIAVAGFIAVTLVPVASALTSAQSRECRAMNASIQIRQNEALEAADLREALLASVEEAGDAWEAAEEVRLFSPAHAADADTRRASYEALKQELMRREMAIQSSVAMINNDVAAYNGRCVEKRASR